MKIKSIIQKKKKERWRDFRRIRREQTKSLIWRKAKYFSYPDYMCMKDMQSGKWVWKTVCILWSIDLGENGRACSRFEWDTEKNPLRTTNQQNSKRLKIGQRALAGQTEQFSYHAQTFPKCFSLKGFTRSPAVLFIPQSIVYWTVPSHLRWWDAWSQVARDSRLS